MRLRDLEREIDKWERPEAEKRTDEIWQRLEALAGEAIALQAKIEKKKQAPPK